MANLQPEPLLPKYLVMHHRAGGKATILKRCHGDDGCYTPYLEADNTFDARIAARDLNRAAETKD